MWEIAALALGQTAGPLLKKAAERHVERFFGDRIADLAKHGKQKPLVQAMEHAWQECIDLILREVRYLGDFADDDPEFRAYFEPLKSYLDQDVVGSELLKPVLDVDRDAPDPRELRFGWDYLDGAPTMPEGFSWPWIAQRYRKALTTGRILSDDLRPQLDTQNLEDVRKLLEGHVGVLPEANEARYAERMREMYRVIDLSAMLPPTALARGWADREDTRELIAERATKDENASARSEALGAIARLLLDRRAVVLFVPVSQRDRPVLRSP